MKKQPTWINKNLFPFESKWAEIDGHQLHYVDEGNGPVVLFVHGTPEWSFGYRDCIKILNQQFRCIVPDYLGFGLSDKPVDGNYTCQAHASRLEKFITQLGLRDILLVVNDFGGGIGLSYAINHPHNVSGIMLFNSWMWSLKDDGHYATPARVMRSWLGRFFYLRLNFPVNVIMPSAFGDRKKLTKEVHRHYKMSSSTREERIALYALTHELIAAGDWWQSLWEQRNLITNKPFTILWGLKDKFIPHYELEKWKTGFPEARIIEFPDAGHFVQEEKPVELAEELAKLLHRATSYSR